MPTYFHLMGNRQYVNMIAMERCSIIIDGRTSLLIASESAESYQLVRKILVHADSIKMTSLERA